MDVKLEYINTFKKGVRSFRITPEERTDRPQPEGTRPLTETGRKLSERRREQLERDRANRW